MYKQYMSVHVCYCMNTSHFKKLKAGGFLVEVSLLLLVVVSMLCEGVLCWFLFPFLFLWFKSEFTVILHTDFNAVHSSGWNDFQTGEKWYLYLLLLDPMLMRSSESTLWTIAALYPALCAFKTCKPYEILIGWWCLHKATHKHSYKIQLAKLTWVKSGIHTITSWSTCKFFK